MGVILFLLKLLAYQLLDDMPRLATRKISSMTPQRNPNVSSTKMITSIATNTKKIDRLSELPNDVLHHVLSFLPIKEAGRTSVLSRKWKILWATMPCLGFYFKEFELLGTKKYLCFVSSAIRYRLKSDFSIFRTIWIGDSDFKANYSRRWIEMAVENQVRVLHIVIRAKSRAKLPRFIFTCQSLEELALFPFPGVKLNWPETLNLISLKTLTLQFFQIDSNLLSTFLSGCPNLQDLNLHFCPLLFSEISSPTLKNLVLENCLIDTNSKFVISAPNLESFRFDDGFWRNCVWEHANEYFKLEFSNLKRLTLGGIWVANQCDAVPFFLRHVPKLEELKIIHHVEELGLVEPVQKDDFADLAFQCKYLKTVKIKCHDNRDKGVENLVNILVKNGVFKKEIFVSDSYDFKEDDLIEMLRSVWFWIHHSNLRNSSILWR